MFERFTNRARHVVVLSQEEARLLNHNYIGTEHILLGLLGEPESIAGTVLASFGFTLEGARAEVEQQIGRGHKELSGHIPFTPRAKKTLELSLREALSIKHNYIGTEHILLGLIREGEGVAAQIMRERTDLTDIRAAVLAAVSAADPGESGEGAEETNAVLRWLRQRLTGRNAPDVPPRPEMPGTASGTRGTPAVEAALQQAATLAGQAPVGSHHLLLAALTDTNSAASAALSSLGVDLEELRARLRSARITGTSDEQPEEAGRRQMSVQVTDEMLTIVCTDPVIVQAGQEALRTVSAGTAKAAARAAALASARESADPEAGGTEAGSAEGGGPEGAEIAAIKAQAEAEQAARERAATATVIRGDLPEAAGFADVWLELRKALNSIADPRTRTRHVVRARRPADTPRLAPPAEAGAASGGNEPDAPEAASS
jgi:ATP-dependent Clp protease ATP-binding subunit ClpA